MHCKRHPGSGRAEERRRRMEARLSGVLARPRVPTGKQVVILRDASRSLNAGLRLPIVPPAKLLPSPTC